MTYPRRMMLEEIRCRNCSECAVQPHLRALDESAQLDLGICILDHDEDARMEILVKREVRIK